VNNLPLPKELQIMAEEKKITAKQRKAIQAIIAGSNRSEAAHDAGIADRTIYKWLELPAFNKALRAAENEAMSNAQAALIGRIEENLQILDEIKKDKENAPGARIRAVQLQLESMITWRNQIYLEERFTEIETRLENAGVL